MAKKVIPRTRTFNKHIYHYWGSYATKQEAQSVAKGVRKEGKRARVTKFAKVYIVYRRR